ncbi:MAG: pyruvate:ferredoxin (flavodoxin) oxidoreductase [Candidatus Margulisbacteria bacterium]|nr:pyruvate:ferredoxin (flavodoxin) oxidoreductase [Candidatus Margulisiibacteriota bacterium]
MEEKKFETIDGNMAVAHVAYALSEVAAIYPITPSSTMGENCDEMARQKRKNIFGQILKIVEMQSEGGAAGAVHGSLTAGSLTTTFTASQGLLLMIPNMYKIAGELLPTVFHVSARSLACQALSIFGDHSDVMAVRQTGFAMLASNSVQEAMDMALVSHLATLDCSVPFLHFFDGFRTSSEVQKIEMISYETIESLVDKKAILKFKERAVNSKHPNLRGTAQNPDIYFQGRETVNNSYTVTPQIVQDVMDKVGKVINRKYKIVEYVGAADADRVLIAIGSGCETIEEYINHANKSGQKLGLVKIRLYRPFPVKQFIDALPVSVKKIAVLDRTKEPGSIGEPLYEDVMTALAETAGRAKFAVSPILTHGRYGLGSKEFNPLMVKAVYENLNAAKPQVEFTVGIKDDVSNLSLDVFPECIDCVPDGTIQCTFWGLGADGTVGANKNSIKIIGNNTDLYAQGYFVYDSKKSGGITISHLRFGPKPIQSTYLITSPDFVACHNQSYIGKYDMISSIREGGTFLLNSNYSREEVFSKLPADMQETIISRKIKFFNINALEIAKSVGLGGRINMVMQTAFFKISKILEENKAIELIKKAIEKEYGKKGADIVQMNWNAVDKTVEALVEIDVPKEVSKNAPRYEYMDYDDPFIREVMKPIATLQGDNLPVSKMSIDGVYPTAMTQFEKRRIASDVPHWLKENCIQCNQCSFVCPHAVIRSKQIEPKNLADKPKTFETIKSNTKNDKNLEYKIQISIEDCTGCGSCVETCPAKEKALVMKPIEQELAAGEAENWKFFRKLPEELTEGAKEGTLKWSQFKQPLFEFPGACGGCGETPYLKLVTQLYGKRMLVANATGCSSIYAGTAPFIPYCKNEQGEGPAWANSLFEDNAEFGLGFRLSVNQTRDTLYQALENILEADASAELKTAAKTMIEIKDKTDKPAEEAADKLVEIIEKEYNKASGNLLKQLSIARESRDYLIDKSVWIIGGDGWAYDIGYGGLDHVLASGENVNILVLDTEVYSNTGGQASKSTPIGAVAKFAASGKKIAKKDLGLIAMSYGYVYVASVSMGANKQQVLNAMLEAEAYKGPSIVIAYSPCINHGYNLRYSMEHASKAVASGYWPLYRYNPIAPDKKFKWDSRPVSADFKEFLLSETRYKSLKTLNPEHAEELYSKAEKDRHTHLEFLQKLSEIN